MAGRVGRGNDMGDLLLKILLVAYVVIAIAYLLQKDYPKCLYFIGAVVLNYGVLLMK